jgi:hypothetical protein
VSWIHLLLLFPVYLFIYLCLINKALNDTEFTGMLPVSSACAQIRKDSPLQYKKNIAFVEFYHWCTFRESRLK